MKKLYVKQKVFKLTDHYPVFDDAQEPVYQVDEEFKIIGKTVHVSDKDGRTAFVIERELFTLLPRFVIRFANGEELTLQSRFTLFHKKIDVLPDEEDIRLEGSFFDYSFKIYRRDEQIGEIERAFLAWGDSFEITVYDEQYQALVVAMMIAVDALIDADQKN